MNRGFFLAVIVSLGLIGYSLLATPTRAADSSRFLEVTSPTARVQLGTQVVATLNRGDVIRVEEDRESWYKVFPGGDETKAGFVRATDVRLLPATYAAPSIWGFVPDVIAAGEFEMDWKTEQVVLTASVPQAAGWDELAVTVPDRAPEVSESLVVRGRSGGVEVTGTGEALVACLTPETRSLWISGLRDGETRYARIDLPSMELLAEVETRRFPNFDEGLVMYLPVVGLLPGYTVEFAEETTNGTRPQGIGREKGRLPRLADVMPRTGNPGVAIRIIVPYLPTAALRTYHFRVRHANGSASQTLVVKRQGDSVNGAGQLVGEARVALLDASVELPNLELLPLNEARQRAKDLGLSPRVVEEMTLKSISSPDLTALVWRQGIDPGGRLLVGSSLLLAIRNVSGSHSVRSHPKVPAGPIPIDVRDDLSFSSIRQGTDTRNEPVSGMLEVGLRPTDLTDDLTSDQADPALLIDSDPGVSLDPARSSEREAQAAILRLMLGALARLPFEVSLPGPVGRAMAEVDRVCEDEFVRAVELGVSPDDAAGQLAIDLTSQALGIPLSVAQNDALMTDWRDHIRLRTTAMWLDRNDNGRLADDTVAWMVIWLFQHGYWDPWQSLEVESTADPRIPPVITFPSPSQAGSQPPRVPDLSGLVLPGRPPLIIPPVRPDQPSPTQPSVPPKGKALVAQGYGPDEVRVPRSAPELVGEVTSRFRDVGLVIARLSELFQNDRIEGSRPEPRVWLPLGSSVELDVRRRVPDVVKRSYADARTTLNDWKLVGRAPGSVAPSDVVIEQFPRAGEYTRPGAEVDLTLRLAVPHVVGEQQSMAAKTLSDRGLGWFSNTKAFTTDRVVDQRPRAGELAERGDRVLLTVHLAVPDVRGRTLTEAKRIFEQSDLVVDVPNRLALGNDVVRGQSPSPGSYVPHESSGRLSPVVARVPDVRGRTIGRAGDMLRSEHNFDVSNLGSLLDDDVVTNQTPSAGTELERGRTITLDARVTLPNVVGNDFAAGRNQLAFLRANLDVRVDGFPQQGDVVYSQDPRGGTLAYPRSTVWLVPGVHVPRVANLTPEEARRRLANVELYGNVVSSSTQETSNRAEAGRVFVTGQTPLAGLYRRDQVQQVDLAVTQLILGMRTVPNVLRMPSSQAIAAVERVGLIPLIQYEGRLVDAGTWRATMLVAAIAGIFGNEPQSDLLICGSDPPSGTEIVVGSRVVLILCQDHLRR